MYWRFQNGSNRPLAKRSRDLVERARRLVVMAEGLLDNHPRIRAAPLRVVDHLLLTEVSGDVVEEVGRHGQVVDAPAFGPPGAVELLQPLPQAHVALPLRELAGDVEKAFGERVPDGVVHGTRARVLVAGLAHVRAKLLVRELGTGKTDDRLTCGQQTVVRE